LRTAFQDANRNIGLRSSNSRISHQRIVSASDVRLTS